MSNITSGLLFNGKSMRNAIIQKIAEDHNLTSALFANSNITILIDIISYMYQSLMTNLQFAASESMFTDTVLLENATRLAKLIGYYAKGAYPYSMTAKLQHSSALTDLHADTARLTDNFLKTTLTYGPHKYNFALVNDIYTENVYDSSSIINADGSYVKLVLADWTSKKFIAGGTKFEEFELTADAATSRYISQQYVNVYVKDRYGKVTKWTYSDLPLFAAYAVNDNAQQRLATKYTASEIDEMNWHRYNFYLDESGAYILKFGDGLSTAMPDAGDEIIVVYLTSTSTADNLSDAAITAMTNAAPARIEKSDNWSAIADLLNLDEPADDIINGEILVLPITTLTGFKPVDTVDSVKLHSSQAFNRQQRVVTKSDYKSYLLEHDSTVADCLIQNNWDFTATFFGYLYNLAKQVKLRDSDNIISPKIADDLGLEFITQAVERGFFTTLDAADANNVYIWTLSKSMLGINDSWFASNSDISFGITDKITHVSEIFDAVKNVTEHVVDVKPIWRTYCPFASTSAVATSNYIKLAAITAMQNFTSVDSAEALLDATGSVFNIYVDLKYINSMARIKTLINKYIKQYLYDNIKLGITPSISSLSTDILSIRGVNAITTAYANQTTDAAINKFEVQGMQFLSWTAGELVNQPVCFDTQLTYGLPQINQFEYLKCAIGYDDFISKFIIVVPDYSRSR